MKEHDRQLDTLIASPPTVNTILGAIEFLREQAMNNPEAYTLLNYQRYANMSDEETVVLAMKQFFNAMLKSHGMLVTHMERCTDPIKIPEVKLP